MWHAYSYPSSKHLWPYVLVEPFPPWIKFLFSRIFLLGLAQLPMVCHTCLCSATLSFVYPPFIPCSLDVNTQTTMGFSETLVRTT